MLDDPSRISSSCFPQPTDTLSIRNRESNRPDDCARRSPSSSRRRPSRSAVRYLAVAPPSLPLTLALNLETVITTASAASAFPPPGPSVAASVVPWQQRCEDWQIYLAPSCERSFGVFMKLKVCLLASTLSLLSNLLQLTIRPFPLLLGGWRLR
jgi:hypothetical protein